LPTPNPQITIAVCTFNGEQRLPHVLEALAAQGTPGPGFLEVVVVDNASTDCTAAVAARSWQGPRESLRVVREPKQGVSHARVRALSEARGRIVGFVDDDNIPAPHWAQRAVEVMEEHPRVGACGGLNEAELSTQEPAWFSRFAHVYAVGPQGDRAGDVTDARGFLWGAGLCLRRRAWEQLRAAGFSPLTTSRKGPQLLSGDDTELCLALRLAGWRLWYEPDLRMKHRIATMRLSWRYLCLLSRADGASSPFLDPYHFALSRSPGGIRRRLARNWWWRTLAAVRNLAQKGLAAALVASSKRQGDHRVLVANWELGRANALLRSRRAYPRDCDRVAQLKARLDDPVPIPGRCQA
jgi:glycosyltransferase involved in cell wall biosynthesis